VHWRINFSMEFPDARSKEIPVFCCGKESAKKGSWAIWINFPISKEHVSGLTTLVHFETLFIWIQICLIIKYNVTL
jgi:hypothetical protein